MKDNIFSICLGNNLNNLYGSINDSILIYNYIYKLSMNKFYNYNWKKPNILFNNSVAESNILKLIKNNKSDFNKLFIFYSGHGFLNGKLKIFKSNNNKSLVSLEELIYQINKYVKNIDLYVILDCCYSGKLIRNTFSNISTINVISSTNNFEKASESITEISNVEERLLSLKENLVKSKNNLIVGTFTFNFYILLEKFIVSNIENFKNLIRDNAIWKKIKIIANQTATVF